MEIHIDFSAPLQGDARVAKINELGSQHVSFCSDSCMSRFLLALLSCPSLMALGFHRVIKMSIK
jgi:hypothetical protein